MLFKNKFLDKYLAFIFVITFLFVIDTVHAYPDMKEQGANEAASESTEKELQEFIEQLNSKQFKKIEEYFETMPKLSHVIKVKNPKTEKESTVILEGLAAFFN